MKYLPTSTQLQMIVYKRTITNAKIQNTNKTPKNTYTKTYKTSGHIH